MSYYYPFETRNPEKISRISHSTGEQRDNAPNPPGSRLNKITLHSTTDYKVDPLLGRIDPYSPHHHPGRVGCAGGGEEDILFDFIALDVTWDVKPY